MQRSTSRCVTPLHPPPRVDNQTRSCNFFGGSAWGWGVGVRGPPTALPPLFLLITFVGALAGALLCIAVGLWAVLLCQRKVVYAWQPGASGPPHHGSPSPPPRCTSRVPMRWGSDWWCTCCTWSTLHRLNFHRNLFLLASLLSACAETTCDMWKRTPLCSCQILLRISFDDSCVSQ